MRNTITFGLALTLTPDDGLGSGPQASANSQTSASRTLAIQFGILSLIVGSLRVREHICELRPRPGFERATDPIGIPAMKASHGKVAAFSIPLLLLALYAALYLWLPFGVGFSDLWARSTLA